MNDVKSSLDIEFKSTEENNDGLAWHKKAIVTFFALTILLDVAIQIVYLFIPLLPLQILSTWTPNISAVLVLLFLIREESSVRNLLSGWKKWSVAPKFYIATISPFIVALSITAAYLALGGVAPGSDPSYSLPMLVGVALIAVFTGATGEELGWRGFALPRLQSRFSALAAGIFVGLWWGLWHMPGWFLLGQTITPMYVLSFMLVCVTESVFMTWLVNSTDGSILMASIFHYSVNMSTGLVTSVLGLITIEVLGLMMALVYGLIIVVLVYRYGYQTLSVEQEPNQDTESGKIVPVLSTT